MLRLLESDRVCGFWQQSRGSGGRKRRKWALAKRLARMQIGPHCVGRTNQELRSGWRQTAAAAAAALRAPKVPDQSKARGARSARNCYERASREGGSIVCLPLVALVGLARAQGAKSRTILLAWAPKWRRRLAEKTADKTASIQFGKQQTIPDWKPQTNEHET